MESKPEYPMITLKVTLFPEEGVIYAKVEYSHATALYDQEVFLLNRDFTVESIKLGDETIDFSAQIVPFTGEDTDYTIKEITVPGIKGKEERLSVTYRGKLDGTTGFSPYVKETINPAFSFFRWETFCYPVFGKATYDNLKKGWDILFTYQLEIEVPKGLVVAAPVRLVEEKTEEDRSIYVYNTDRPITLSALSFSVAPYRVTTSDIGVVYTFNESAGYVEGLVQDLKKVDAFYRSHFGDIDFIKGLKLIEIPEGFGSFVPLNTVIFLVQGGLKPDIYGRHQIFHEYAHLGWNAKTGREVQRCRFFDEAFAQYLSGRAMQEIYGEDILSKYMERLRQGYIGRVVNDSTRAETPIVEYGKYEYGGLSYTAGAWVLYILNKALGDDVFDKKIEDFLKEYRDKEADFESFYSFFETIGGFDAEGFFRDWIFGTNGLQKLRSGVSIDEIVKQYVM
jgi:aminopeptidase N